MPERNRSGPPEAHILPSYPKCEPPPKRFLPSGRAGSLVCRRHVRIIRMNPIDMSNGNHESPELHRFQFTPLSVFLPAICVMDS